MKTYIASVAIAILASLSTATVTNTPRLNGPILPVPLDDLKFAKTRTSQFVHPGLWHTHEDLETIRTNALSGVEPWASAYDQFSVDSYSLSNYTMQGPKTVLVRGTGSNYTTFTKDVRAAWQNALMWYITKEDAHWTRATTILDAWGTNLTDVTGTDASLMIGLEGSMFANAAEIMRWEGNWTEATSKWQGSSGFSIQLYWLFARQSIINGQANYGMVSIKALLDFAVYLDDITMYNYALHLYQKDLCAGLYGNFDPATGQSAESGRDQGHVQSGIAWTALAARTVQSQGGDLYSMSDNLLLKAAEYTAKYNLNYTVDYDPSFYRCEAVLVGGPWDEIAEYNRGIGVVMAWDIIYYQYVAKRGLDAPWTTQAKEAFGFEGHALNDDHPSWGDLIWAYAADNSTTAAVGNVTRRGY